MTSARSQILEVVRQHPDLTTMELVSLCPRRFAHDNINATHLGQQLRALKRLGRVTASSENPRRWRVKE